MTAKRLKPKDLDILLRNCGLHDYLSILDDEVTSILQYTRNKQVIAKGSNILLAKFIAVFVEGMYFERELSHINKQKNKGSKQ